MKIAVVTLPLHTNYGGILQAYALRSVLARAGHEVVVARFRESAAQRLSHPLSVFLKQRGIVPYSHNYPLSAKEHAVIRCNTEKFIDKHIRRTNPLSGREMAACGFGAFVVGSDQVWRHYDPRYFLGFLPDGDVSKKISYAASFGIGSWPFSEGQTEEAKKLAARFDAVSVREDSGVGMCADNLGIETELVLDPTLLLKKEDYLALIPEAEESVKAHGQAAVESGNIFSYILDSTPSKEAVTAKAAELLGADINSIVPTVRPGKGVDIERCVWPSVERWIEGFERARFVVTDSFHGTALSILFNKPFIAVCNDDRGAARFHSLLRMFGLEERLVSHCEIPDEGLFTGKVDFAPVNEILAARRRESLEFLKNALQE